MKIISLLKGVALGAGLAYLFDPSQGRRRRARIRDKTVHVWDKTGDTIEAKTRNIANRAQGVLHDATSALMPERLRAGNAGTPTTGRTLGGPLLNWSPTARILVTAGAGLLALYGKHKGGVLGTALGAVSVAVITNSVAAGDARYNFTQSPALPSDLPDVDQRSDAIFTANFSELKPREARST